MEENKPSTTISEDAATATKTVEDLSSGESEITTPATEIKTKRAWYKETKYIAAVSVIIVLAIAAVLLFVTNRSESNSDQQGSSLSNQPVELASVLALKEGTVELSEDGNNWQGADSGQTIDVGSHVRTLADSRAALVLDDGSAIRLDENSEIRLVTIDDDASEVSLLAGQVYSRVVKSDAREFSITTNREQFKAMGTAYKTVVGDTSDEVQVYESSVRAETEGVEVDEGNQYDTESKEESSIDLEGLSKDEFVQWNKEQDSNNNDFKDELGVLDLKTNGEDDEASEETAPSDPVASLSLGGSTADKGVRLEWTNSGVNANDGYKIVYDKNDPTPTYKENMSQYAGPDNKSFLVGLGDGKTYTFRICAYRAKQGTCVSYSNAITIKAPLVEKEKVVSGEVSLAIDGRNISWEFGGTAPHGFKVVLSTSGSPAYPADSIAFVSADKKTYMLPEKPAGEYRVRVCKYTADSNINGGCTDYSNEVGYNVSE